MNRRLPSGVFVTTDSPDYLERQVEPERKLATFESMDPAAIVKEWRASQDGYSTTPFDVLGDRLRLFPGGATIWSGFPGAGKTTILRQLICHLLRVGDPVFAASLEENPREMYIGLVQSARGREDVTESDVEWFGFALAEKLKVWGVIDEVASYREMLALIRVLAKQGLRHAVIDSLMCLDVRNDDYEAQRQFAVSLVKTARASNVHIHLVAHPRKLVSSDQDLDLNDVAGSADLGRLVDNVVFVRRAKGEASVAGATADLKPMAFSIRKQRKGSGWCGDIEGWFHRPMRQFHTSQFVMGPTRYLPDAAYQ